VVKGEGGGKSTNNKIEILVQLDGLRGLSKTASLPKYLMGWSKRVYDTIMSAWPLIRVGYWLGKQPVIGPLMQPLFSSRAHHATILPVHVGIPSPRQTPLPAIMLEKLIEQASARFMMKECVCRTHEHCNTYPATFGCLFLGHGAGEIHPTMGRLVSVEQAKNHIHQALEHGLTPMIAHTMVDAVTIGINYRRMLTVCFCCDCCCTIRTGLRSGPPAFWEIVQRLPGLEVTVNDDCVMCKACFESCPVGAISLNHDRALIASHCKGCGRCVPACPNGAIRLQQLADLDPLEGLMQRIEKRTDIRRNGKVGEGKH
jgi:Fe-S-cluster-containing hydrogenase component 2